MRRANDPQRREKIIQATLEAVKLYGIHAVTHRKIAALAGVPLGSMTYYFSGIDELLLEAFSRFTEIMSRQYQAFFSDVSDAPGACQAITDMIYSSQVATPDNMELMYQLYALASRKPLLKTVMQNWMQETDNHWHKTDNQSGNQHLTANRAQAVINTATGAQTNACHKHH